MLCGERDDDQNITKYGVTIKGGTILSASGKAIYTNNIATTKIEGRNNKIYRK